MTIGISVYATFIAVGVVTLTMLLSTVIHPIDDQAEAGGKLLDESSKNGEALVPGQSTATPPVLVPATT